MRINETKNKNNREKTIKPSMAIKIFPERKKVHGIVYPVEFTSVNA